MGLAGVVESEEGATPCAPVELCAGGSGWQEGGGPCAMTEIGQIKKEKAIFNTILMGIRRVGRNATPRIRGRDDALTFAFYNGPNWLNKQVKTFFRRQGNH